MDTQIHSLQGHYQPEQHQLLNEVNASFTSKQPAGSEFKQHGLSSRSNYSSSSAVSNLSERLSHVDFDTPAKIFQSKHAIHQLENITPDVSTPVKFIFESDYTSGNQTPDEESPPPRSLSPELHENNYHRDNIKKLNSPDRCDSDNNSNVGSQLGSTTISRVNTPSQFVFKKPEYDSHYHHTHFHHFEKKDTIFHDLKRFFKKNQEKKKKKVVIEDQSDIRSSNSSVYSKQTDLSFANEFNKNIQSRYGRWGDFVGKGSGGSVRIIRRNTDGKTFAVKEFRKRVAGENEKEYIKKVTAEFCIGSTLHNYNVIEALDIVQEGNTFYEIMEYAPNDIFNIVMSGKMDIDEIACCWRQLLNGVQYLQSMGIAHRDLKLDNMVLDDRGIVKIIDFGCSTVIKYPFNEQFHMSKGICGSDPYIAPEQYTQKEYDARKTDLWSCGIIFICMIIRRFPWRVPRPDKDQSFSSFIEEDNSGAEKLFNLLPRYARPIVSRILVPDPKKRCTLKDVFEDKWVSKINVCTPDKPASNHPHHLLFKPSKDIMSRGNIIVLPHRKGDN